MPTSTQSIREILATQPSAAGVFHRFDIDLCSQAELSLDGACKELQLSVDQVLEKLDDAEAQEHGGALSESASLTLGRLVQHIVRVHHQRVRQDLPRLVELAHKVAATRGDHAPELTRLVELVEKLHAEMYAHIQKEEQVLFPFISQMDQESIVAYPSAHACFHSVAHPIFMMEQEHEAASLIFTELDQLTKHFEPPSRACGTHIALYSLLRSFTTDLKQHVHLENDILFPRAIQLEAELKMRS